MRKLYLIGAVTVFLLILILALPQIGSTCVWYLISTNTNPTFVLFQTAGLGAILGGNLVLFWKSGRKISMDDEGGGNETERGNN